MVQWVSQVWKRARRESPCRLACQIEAALVLWTRSLTPASVASQVVVSSARRGSSVSVRLTPKGLSRILPVRTHGRCSQPLRRCRRLEQVG